MMHQNQHHTSHIYLHITNTYKVQNAHAHERTAGRWRVGAHDDAPEPAPYIRHLSTYITYTYKVQNAHAHERTAGRWRVEAHDDAPEPAPYIAHLSTYNIYVQSTERACSRAHSRQVKSRSTWWPEPAPYIAHLSTYITYAYKVQNAHAHERTAGRWRVEAHDDAPEPAPYIVHLAYVPYRIVPIIILIRCWPTPCTPSHVLSTKYRACMEHDGRM